MGGGHHHRRRGAGIAAGLSADPAAGPCHQQRGGVAVLIRSVAETGSTNADLLALAAAGAAEGDWLRADSQTAGRGRQGRPWQSPPGNLYASTLVRLRPHDPPAATLAMVAAVALEEIVSLVLERRDDARSDARASLKWPNDLLLGGAKLSGILLERAGDTVVVGIGVNLARHPDDLDRPVTSLAAHGPAIAPPAFLDMLADCFARWLGRWRTEGLSAVRQRWSDRAHPPGTALSANLPDGSRVEGLYVRIDADGALVLRLADGDTRVIHAADVFLI